MPEAFTFEEATEPETFSFEDVQEKPEVSGPPPELTPFPGPYGVPMGAWEQPLVTVPPKVTETGRIGFHAQTAKWDALSRLRVDVRTTPEVISMT